MQMSACIGRSCSSRWNFADGVAVGPFMAAAPYFSPTLLLDDIAPEAWIFLDYEDDGRVLVLSPKQYEAIYRPDPEDQGGRIPRLVYLTREGTPAVCPGPASPPQPQKSRAVIRSWPAS